MQSQTHWGCNPSPNGVAIPAPLAFQPQFPCALHSHPFAPPAAKPSSPPRHHTPTTPNNLFNPFITGRVFTRKWILRCLLLGLSCLKTSRHVTGEGGQEEKGSAPCPARDQGRNGAASRSFSALEGKAKGSAQPSPPAAQPGPPCARPAAHRKFLGVFGHSSSAAYF